MDFHRDLQRVFYMTKRQTNKHILYQQDNCHLYSIRTRRNMKLKIVLESKMLVNKLLRHFF